MGSQLFAFVHVIILVEPLCFTAVNSIDMYHLLVLKCEYDLDLTCFNIHQLHYNTFTPYVSCWTFHNENRKIKGQNSMSTNNMPLFMFIWSLWTHTTHMTQKFKRSLKKLYIHPSIAKYKYLSDMMCIEVILKTILVPITQFW